MTLRSAALVAAASGLLALLWLLDSTHSDLVAARAASEQAQEMLADQAAQSKALADRLDRLDVSLTTLERENRAGADRLAGLAAAISAVEKTEEDTDASVACLGERLPADLDRRLR